MKKLIVLALCCTSSAFAQVTPTPTPTATPNPCLDVAACVYETVPQTVTTCFSATPTCTDTNQRQFAVTAEQLAELAIENKKCRTTSFKTRGRCNECFQKAKFPLRDRFYGKLFKGLLGRAVTIIEAERKTTCAELPVKAKS